MALALIFAIQTAAVPLPFQARLQTTQHAHARTGGGRPVLVCAATLFEYLQMATRGGARGVALDVFVEVDGFVFEVLQLCLRLQLLLLLLIRTELALHLCGRNGS